jgi:DNA-binding Xre family transcriptional regulator
MTDSSEDFADRVWLAYWSLPRIDRGRPESFHRLEKRHGISNGTLGEISSGKRQSVTTPTLGKIANALRVAAGWLADGTGVAPTPTGPVPARTPEAAADVEETGENPTLRMAVSPEVARAVNNAVDRALHEASFDATAAQVLTLALMHVSGLRQTN